MKWLVVLVAACTSAVSPLPEPEPPHARSPCGRSCVDMYVVAHEDDDLLFMNPDIADSIASGNRVVVVYLTAGDLQTPVLADKPDAPDFTRYWVDRERGILNAYAFMALGGDHALDTYQVTALPKGWAAQLITAGGVTMPQYDLAGSSVTTVFVRLSDFELEDAWFDLPGRGGERLVGSVMLPPGATVTNDCAGEVCPLRTDLASQIVSRDQLLAALEELIERFGADSVSAQDATTPTANAGGMYWDALGVPEFSSDAAGYTEYWDHVFGAAFALTAATRAQAARGTPLQVRLYRGYTLSQEPPNLSVERARSKLAVFGAYALFDDGLVPRGEDASHATLRGDYDLAARGSWQSRELATRTVVGTAALTGRLAIAGSCLGVAAPAVAATTPTQLAEVGCDGAPAWQLTPLGQIALAGTAQCIALDSSGIAQLAPCEPRSVASTLLLFGNGQLRTADARCLALGDGGFASVDCDHQPLAPHATGEVIASQDWTLLFAPVARVSSELAATFEYTYDATFRVLPGEVCARRSDGLICAAGNGALAIDPMLSDAAGWQPAAYGETVAAVADPSGSVVACGRDPAGVHCGGLASTAFSDADGWGAHESYYGSLRYADLTGDGELGACGRGENGLACVTGDWQVLRLWTTAFSDAEGWAAPAYGDTIALADLDGDGLADACGRSAYGLECVVQRPSATGPVLADDAVWSFDRDRSIAGTAADFSDADPAESWTASPRAFRSLRLVDINHDGLADACGRGNAGIYCALSTGTAFERKKLVVAAALAHGVLAWGNVAGDGKLGVCALAGDGVWCAAGY